MGPLLLLLLARVAAVHCGHSLQYYYTGVSEPGYGLPEFSIVGYVDGIQITQYSSDTGRIAPTVEWMKKVDPDYWEQETQNGKHNQALFKHNVKTVMDSFNHTRGFHSLQWMYGCELRDDGSTRGYYQYGYDGKDFLALDTERGVFVPLTDQAQIKAQRVNSPEVRAGERDKKYLETDCIDWLKNHVENGKEELERRVRPEVKVSNQNVNGVTKLHCQVYGFYPRDVDVNWRRNGIDVPSDEAKHVLPNTDGTFQIRVTVEAAAEDGGSYSCHVDHVSLDQTLSVKWEPPWRSYILRIAICVLAGVIASAAVGLVIWRKRSGKKMTYVEAYGKNLPSATPNEALRHVG